MVQGVLLDVDGTLVLSNGAHAQAWVEAFAKFGYRVVFKEVRQLIGMGGDKLMPKIVPGLGKESDKGEKISQYRTKLFLDKYAPNLKPAPGSRELVQKLKNSGLRVVIASSAKEQELGALLKAAKLDDLLHEATTSDDADKSKPDPDIVQAALDRLDMPKDQVLMIGDTPYDVEAAGRAGIQLVAVRCGGWADKELVGAIAIYDDPADIAAHYETSPLAH